MVNLDSLLFFPWWIWLPHVWLSQMLDGGPLLRHGEEPLKGFFFFSQCLFYHPSLCSLLHFRVLFNDFQLFIIQRKAGSRRLWLNQCPLSLHGPHFYFPITQSDSLSLPFTSSLSLILSLSRICVFHSSSRWPINHLCWREQPTVLCNFSPPNPPLSIKPNMAWQTARSVCSKH